MGMFDKDKEIGNNLTTMFQKGKQIILYGAELAGEVETSLGAARKTVLHVAPHDDPENRFDVVTLASAIADKAAEADDSDFPCVVYWTEVPSNYGGNAVVLQWVADWQPANAAA